MSVCKQLKIIDIDRNKCVNCHLCITTCPVKYCNNGSGSVVEINNDLCIACGNCLSVCTHGARFYVDDFSQFMQALAAGEKVVAIVAPSIAANFDETYLNINAWLKSIGVSAVFDVSFGAELAVASYLHYIKTAKPQTVIAQPCAAIVSYIETFRPEMIKYLAPIDSPMVHTMKLIRNFYHEYKDHKIAILSPCIAKKREFIDTGYGDFNISFLSLDSYLQKNAISLSDYPAMQYDNPPAERAVLFSSPGGLLQTIERWEPEIRNKTRKIEGVSKVYEYLDSLPSSIENGSAPLLVDCLNCEKGCNGGPLTLSKNSPIDEIEQRVIKRKQQMQAYYKDEELKQNTDANKQIESLLMKYWNDTLYTRSYRDTSSHNEIKTPSPEQLKDIYRRMHKYSANDIYNCSACGYSRCERMATAIFNGLNKPENCHFYLASEREIVHKETLLEKNRLMNVLFSNMLEGFIRIDENGIIVDANQAVYDIFEITDHKGKSIFDLFAGTSQEKIKHHIKDANTKGSCTYELEFLASSNRLVYCLFNQTVIKDTNNNQLGVYIIVTDLTEQKLAEKELIKAKDELEERVVERTQELMATVEELKQAEEEIASQRDAVEAKAIALSKTLSELEASQALIRESEKNFLLAFYQSVDAALLLDGELIAYCNDAAVSFFGCKTRDEVIGKTILCFSPPTQNTNSCSIECATKMIQNTIQNGFNRFEWKHIKLDGSEFDAEISLSIVLLQGKSMIQARLLDLTEKKMMERKLREQQDIVMDMNEELRQTFEDVASQRDILEEQNATLENTLQQLELSQNEIIHQRDSLALAIKEIKNAEQKINSLVQSMPDAVLVVDKDGVITLWNEALERLTGVKAEDMIGKGNYEYSLPFYHERRKMLIDLAFESREVIEQNYTNVEINGEIIVAEAYMPHWDDKGVYMHGSAACLRDTDGNIIGAVEIIRDVTERVNNEIKIKEQQEEVLATNDELLFKSNELASQRDLLQQQKEELETALEMLEKSQSKIVESEKMVALGQLIAGVAHEINTPLGAIRSSVGNITHTLDQIMISLPEFFISLSQDDRNHFFALLQQSMHASLTVTSKEERAYKRAIISQLEDESVQLADEIADTLVDMGIYKEIELFLPLFKSDKCSHVLQMAYKMSGLLRSSKTITTATERASKVVFALKNFAHYDHSGETTKANIADLIETVLTLYHNQLKLGVTVTKRFEPIPEISCFPDELNQVWTNLLHNAIQAMDYKGEILIEIKQDAELVYISMTDSGKGIPIEIQDKIFNAFFTTKPQGEGSGLGLDIVKRIVEKHLGKIWFTSQPGKTTFTVQLPKK